MTILGTLMTLMITLAMMITPLAALLVASVPERCTEPTHPTMFAFRFFISVPLQMRMVIVNEMAHVGANGSPRATRRTSSSHNICGHLPTDGLAASAARHQAARAPNRTVCLDGSGIGESFRTACTLLAGLLIAVTQAGGSAPSCFITSTFLLVRAGPHPPRTSLMLFPVAAAATLHLPGSIAARVKLAIHSGGCRSWASSARLLLGLKPPLAPLLTTPTSAFPRNDTPPEVLNSPSGSGGPFAGIGLGSMLTVLGLWRLPPHSNAAAGHPFPFLDEVVRLPCADKNHSHVPGRNVDRVLAKSSAALGTTYIMQHPKPGSPVTIPDCPVRRVEPDASQFPDRVVPIGSPDDHAHPFPGFPPHLVQASLVSPAPDSYRCPRVFLAC